MTLKYNLCGETDMDHYHSRPGRNVDRGWPGVWRRATQEPLPLPTQTVTWVVGHLGIPQGREAQGWPEDPKEGSCNLQAPSPRSPRDTTSPPKKLKQKNQRKTPGTAER